MSATPAHPTPGRDCLEQGGIFVPNATCDDPPPATIAFQNQNGYYAWERVINHADGRVEITGPQDDPSARRYMGKAVTDSAVSWITGRKGNQKWMVTAAYPQIHTPYQQVPQSLLPPDSDDLSNVDCTPNLPNGQGIANYHLLSNQMLESMDSEIGRLLVQTGLASYNADGSLNYQPEKTDTMVVVIGDNGTYGAGVKEPFDPSRSKGYVYQTGVWVPLIVAGPMVRSPDRHVASMVNVADVFELFGEIAGIDVHQAVPASHILDSQPMLAYLTNPNQASIRQTNFTQTGANIHPTAPPPCVISVTGAPICIQLFTSQGVCEFEGGQWYGPPATVQFTSCCACSNAHLAPYPDGVTIVPDFQSAIRNDGFKLVQMSVPDCSQQPDDQGQFPDVTLNEFYQINEAVPPELDKDGTALCADTLASGVVTQNCPNTLTQQQAAVYNSLYTSLASPNGILNSEPECPGTAISTKSSTRRTSTCGSSFRSR